MCETCGVIYILTNPAFSDYVKIGYADDLNRRLNQLNSSECIPFAFRAYATYAVTSRLTDRSIHEMIDRLNPDLRSSENIDGHLRVREFFAMSPEDAYAVLRLIAQVSGTEDRLTLIHASAAELADEQMAQEVDTVSVERRANFSFGRCGIPIGATIEYARNRSITATVASDCKVNYNGEILYLTALAKRLTGRTCDIAGPRFFMYNGEMLNDIRHRMGW